MPRLPATELINRIENGEMILADGAMGTELIRRGALPSETLNCNQTHPDWVRAIHTEYVEAGARLLYSNTFAPPKSREEYADVLAGWQILQNVCRDTKEKVWAALSLYPATVIEHPDLMDQIFALPNAPNLVVIETCCSLKEAKSAVKETRRRTAAYIFATATFSGANGNMIDGTSLERWFAYCENNVNIFGFGLNCDTIWNGLRSRKPFLVKMNAGKPQNDSSSISQSAKHWAEAVSMIFRSSRVLGGCCNTTPDHIRELGRELDKRRSSTQKQVTF